MTDTQIDYLISTYSLRPVELITILRLKRPMSLYVHKGGISEKDFNSQGPNQIL